MQWSIVLLLFSLYFLNPIECSHRHSKSEMEKLRKNIAKAQDDLNGGKFSPKLKQIINKISLSSDTRAESALEFVACNACFSGIDEFMYLRRVELLNDTYLMELVTELCTVFEVSKEEVCRGFVDFYAPSIIYIVDNRPDLSADTVCRVIFDGEDCSNPHEDDNLNFSIEIEEQSFRETPELLSTNSSSLSMDDIIIVHLTDIHVDFKYEMGAIAECKEYACCRDKNILKETVNSSHLAGYWGDYRSCDTPLYAIEEAFHHIVNEHRKIDVIYFTGDVVDHFMWDSTFDGMKKSMTEIYGLMKNVFKDIPIYPVIGNHETQNLFAPYYVENPSISTQWLYNHIIEIWSDKMTNESIETFKNGGYYTVLVRPGLRVVALNNNICYIYNFWVFYDAEPMREQFQWLHDTLLEAETNSEKVHILTHIPTGIDEVHEPCSREYNRIIQRFKDTIVAQFNGHIEMFGFHLFYETENFTSPISVAFNGGSLASFSRANRNYVVYNAHPKTFEVKEAEVWTYNLTYANQHEKPLWYKQPSLRETFNLPDLMPATMSNFAMEMMKNSTVFQQFWQQKIKNSDTLLKEGCDSECFKEAICEIIASDNTHAKLCESMWD